jgi:uncharacterized protein involved in cysteine biosynthesis
MPTVLSAVARAMGDLAQPRVLAVLFLPMLIAALVWAALAFIFWDTWTAAIRSLVEGAAIAGWLIERGAAWVLDSIGVIVTIALLLPAAFATALVLTELVAMPVIVSVAARRYGVLETRKGGTIVGSIANAVFAVAIFALLWIVTLPLWLTGIGALVLPALNSAYLNQRLFRYDALADHASRDEYVAIVRRNKMRLFGLGLVLAPLYYVPVLNLTAPVIAGLAFTHFCLAELARLRRGA